MEAKLGMLEKRELAWKEEKREALAELDLAKQRIREEVLKDIFCISCSCPPDFLCSSQGLERNIQHFLMIFLYFEKILTFFLGLEGV